MKRSFSDYSLNSSSVVTIVRTIFFSHSVMFCIVCTMKQQFRNYVKINGKNKMHDVHRWKERVYAIKCIQRFSVSWENERARAREIISGNGFPNGFVAFISYMHTKRILDERWKWSRTKWCREFEIEHTHTQTQTLTYIDRSRPLAWANGKFNKSRCFVESLNRALDQDLLQMIVRFEKLDAPL